MITEELGGTRRSSGTLQGTQRKLQGTPWELGTITGNSGKFQGIWLSAGRLGELCGTRQLRGTRGSCGVFGELCGTRELWRNSRNLRKTRDRVRDSGNSRISGKSENYEGARRNWEELGHLWGSSGKVTEAPRHSGITNELGGTPWNLGQLRRIRRSSEKFGGAPRNSGSSEELRRAPRNFRELDGAPRNSGNLVIFRELEDPGTRGALESPGKLRGP